MAEVWKRLRLHLNTPKPMLKLMENQFEKIICQFKENGFLIFIFQLILDQKKYLIILKMEVG